MDEKERWIESKAIASNSETFIKTILEKSGYKVKNYGIENHNTEIKKIIRTNYNVPTNRRILAMPDFVVIDENKKESMLVEVKHRNYKGFFNQEVSNILFHYGKMKTYLEFWNDSIIIITMNKEPYIICIKVSEINWNKHYIERFTNKQGLKDEVWNFSGIYHDIIDLFPKVTQENIDSSMKFLKIK